MHEVIFLWSHPRSVSTATERIMRERGDLQCMHEPFLHYYYLNRSNKPLPHFDSEADHPTSYEGTRESILQLAEQGPVFAKDMSYYVVPELLEDEAFFSRIRHCFLIRHPRKSILSYYRLDPDFSCEEVGITAQWQHYQAVEAAGLKKPIVLEAEAIQADSRNLMKLFWQALGLDFKENAFDWDSNQPPEDWRYVKGWHEKAERSAAIKPELADEEAESIRQFEQAVEQAPHLETFLQAHLPAYDSLKARSLSAKAETI